MATWRYSTSSAAEMTSESATTDDDHDTLDLCYSELVEYPHDLLNSCRQLHSLHIANNHITVLPAQVALLNTLVSLDISNNRLKSVADELCSLQHLRSLVARNNCLTVESIPKDFGTLPSLAVLNLSGNELTQLPVQFTELPRLQCLYLGANQISLVPPEVENMSK